MPAKAVKHPGSAPGPGPSARPRRRLRHRLPVRLRRHWPTLGALCATVLVLSLLVGAERVRPYVSSELVAEETVIHDIEGEGDLFDDGEHDIQVTFNEDEYADMLRVFREEGEKQYIRADIVIDGTTINDVALRLKGNSTLMELRGDGFGGEPGVPVEDDGELPDGGLPDGARPAQRGELAGAEEPERDAALSEDHPETLPWLISFDEFQAGRAYQGRTEIALRPGTMTSGTALNEALALSLTADDGQPTQRFTFASVSVNGGDSAPRLLLESPDGPWATELGEGGLGEGAPGDGVLYKARAGGSFDYLGDDPTDYEESFRQINGLGSHDLTPVMRLLRFVDEADDEEFAERLGEFVDIDSFARYLATQALFANFDGMNGPGNNYYLWYDIEEERFTVLSWDLNLAFAGMGDGRVTEGIELPGEAELPGDGTLPEGGGPPGDGPLPDGGGSPDGGGLPDGGAFTDEGQLPDGARSPAETDEEDDGAGGMMRMEGVGSGALVNRFLADDAFDELYENAYAELRERYVGDAGGVDSVRDLLDSLAARAERAGDDEAARAADELTGLLAQTPEDPDDTPLGSGGGRGPAPPEETGGLPEGAAPPE
ncbi:CotH kinase family protein [Streptomyces sedi]|uniref:Spore coat protein CotH n=1 Tax=Streptomyces sedi TaxID=555059 RepID=A0A5C4VEB2_9ACTN|nr:CotH kinase family protein [Streptomyces sedi]TNM34250.1 spore coat protein CotH [Streptomyces sedi]